MGVEKPNSDADFSGLAPDLPRSYHELAPRAPAAEVAAPIRAGAVAELEASIVTPASVVTKQRRGAPIGNKNALKHGLKASNRKPFDKRRGTDRRALATVAAIEEALGARATPQRALIIANIGRYLRDYALLQAWEDRKHDGEIVAKGGKVYPTTEARWKLLERIERALERIGLDREQRDAIDLAGHLAETYGKRATGG